MGHIVILPITKIDLSSILLDLECKTQSRELNGKKNWKKERQEQEEGTFWTPRIWTALSVSVKGKASAALKQVFSTDYWLPEVGRNEIGKGGEVSQGAAMYIMLTVV